MTTLTALYPISEIREIEHAASAGLPAGTLMQRAGVAAAQLAQSLIPDTLFGNDDQPVLILAGPGNNGGDALEVAANLADAGFKVCVLLYADETRQSTEAQQALLRARSTQVRFEDTSHAAQTLEESWALVVDGLFGIGLVRPVTGALRELVDGINRLACPVLALDIPSGIDADTGVVVGDSVAIRASHTITFIGDKLGLHTGQARDYTGRITVCDLDLAPTCFNEPVAFLNSIDLFSGSLRQRAHHSHKGSNGDVAVIGGAAGMGGAPILSARAAAQAGAGRVFVGFVDAAPSYDSRHPELMLRQAQALDFATATLVVGPGLGNSNDARALLHRALQTSSPLVLDADALNLLATDAELQQMLAQRTGSTIITPHPLEAARLLSLSTATIESDRPAAVRSLARRFNAIAILKGSGTVIADPAGRIVINPTGNPALATAGTGDVLAGICGALLAQDWPQWRAALAAVWLHGQAADDLVAQGVGPIGLTASELIPAVRARLNSLVAQHASRRFAL